MSSARSLALAAVTVVSLAACSSGTVPTTATTTGASLASTSSSPTESALAVDSPTAEPSTSTSSAPATATETSPSQSAETSATPAAPSPSRSTRTGGGTPATCSAAGRTVPTVSGVPGAVRSTVTKLAQAAAACDRATLVALTAGATFSATDLSAAEAWSLPDKDGRYAAVLRLLRLRSQKQDVGDEGFSYVWPRVESESGFYDDTAWAELVDAGWLTAAQAKTMKASGYTGWRLHVTADGKVTAMLTGR